MPSNRPMTRTNQARCRSQKVTLGVFVSGFFLMLGLMLSLLIAQPAFAMSDDQKTALSTISNQFNRTKTMNGEFIQTAPNGDTLQGHFFIQRPGKIRFYYSKPSFTDIISDGKALSIEDRKLKTQDIYPLNKTPLKVLLSERLDLANDKRVRQAAVADDIVSVVVEQESLLGDGILTLIFERESALLRQWTIQDAQGNETTVTVFNVETGRPIKKSLFKIKRDLNTY